MKSHAVVNQAGATASRRRLWRRRSAAAIFVGQKPDVLMPAATKLNNISTPQAASSSPQTLHSFSVNANIRQTGAAGRHALPDYPDVLSDYPVADVDSQRRY